jgi:hypothetical protein
VPQVAANLDMFAVDNGKLPVQGVAGIRNFDRGNVKATLLELQT